MSMLTRSRLNELRRTALGVAVALWVIVLAYGAGRAAAAGPQWGLSLAEDGAGRVMAAEVTVSGVAGQRMKSGFDIVAIDGLDAHQFLDGVPSAAHEISFRDAAGAVSSVRVEDSSA